VDRRAAFRGLAAGELDLAIVFEHAFEPDPPPEGVELIALFDDPPRVLLPGDHRLARRRRVAASELAADAWVRAHDGSGARLVDHVLMHADLRPPILLAGRGDEPVEAQALVAAGKGVTIAHELGVIISDRIAVRPLTGGAPVRRVQAALMEGQLAPAARAALEALRTAARARRRS
jgi:DNA-binding transcriptional LysR family regulator